MVGLCSKPYQEVSTLSTASSVEARKRSQKSFSVSIVGSAFSFMDVAGLWVWGGFTHPVAGLGGSELAGRGGMRLSGGDGERSAFDRMERVFDGISVARWVQRAVVWTWVCPSSLLIIGNV